MIDENNELIPPKYIGNRIRWNYIKRYLQKSNGNETL